MQIIKNVHFILFREHNYILIKRRILWHYTPMVRVSSFLDALEAISNYCSELRYKKAIVYDPQGANPKMVIRYWQDSRMKLWLKTHPSCLRVQPVINNWSEKLLITANNIYQQFKINSYENRK